MRRENFKNFGESVLLGGAEGVSTPIKSVRAFQSEKLVDVSVGKHLDECFGPAQVRDFMPGENSPERNALGENLVAGGHWKLLEKNFDRAKFDRLFIVVRNEQDLPKIKIAVTLAFQNTEVDGRFVKFLERGRHVAFMNEQLIVGRRHPGIGDLFDARQLHARVKIEFIKRVREGQDGRSRFVRS